MSEQATRGTQHDQAEQQTKTPPGDGYGGEAVTVYPLLTYAISSLPDGRLALELTVMGVGMAPEKVQVVGLPRLLADEIGAALRRTAAAS